MKNSYLMAVDMGVSFIKVGLYDTESNLLGAVNEKVPGHYPKPGVFIQKAEDYLKIVLDTIKKCIRFYKGLRRKHCMHWFFCRYGRSYGYR
jgi:xylulokinase